MLTHPTLDQLHALGLHGMAKGFKDLGAHPETASLDHAAWLALLLDHETTLRRQKRFERLARMAVGDRAQSRYEISLMALRKGRVCPQFKSFLSVCFNAREF